MPALHELSPRGREIVLAYVGSIWVAGIAEGFRRAEASYSERHEVVRAIVRRLAETPPYDVAADLRGQPERAEAQRATLRTRGLLE